MSELLHFGAPVEPVPETPARHAVLDLICDDSEVYAALEAHACRAPDPDALAETVDWVRVRLRERGYEPERRSHLYEVQAVMSEVWGSDPGTYPGAAWDYERAADIRDKTMRRIAESVAAAGDPEIEAVLNEMAEAESRADIEAYRSAALRAYKAAKVLVTPPPEREVTEPGPEPVESSEPGEDHGERVSVETSGDGEAREDKPSPVARLFADPPDWLVRHAAQYRTAPDRYRKSLCAAVAAALGLDASEIRDEVDEQLDR